jgi:hypothetical protein
MKKSTIKKLTLNKSTISHLPKITQLNIAGGQVISTIPCNPTPATMCFVCPPKTYNRTCGCATTSVQLCCE